MSENYQPHHSTYLDKARLSIGDATIDLGTVTDLMNHADWADVVALRIKIEEEILPPLDTLRANAKERLAEYRQLPDSRDMHEGRTPYPDQHLIVDEKPVRHSLPPAKEPYKLPARSAHMGRGLIVLHGGENESEDAVQAVADQLGSFETNVRERQDSLAVVLKGLMRTFHSGAYDLEEITAFQQMAQAELEPGAREWENVLVYVNRAMDKFEAGADERQEIMAWLYVTTKKRPDALILPTVTKNELDRLEVRFGELVVYSDTGEDEEPGEPEELAA